ncbi:hypothetical protein LOD99_9722 [Oopsacas minuta]|uniref:RIMB1/RIM3A-C-like N-terminal domain-containing protein n=1 Tax=Oopsacas minuta TaxID=111878 RepID=A0AAV7KST1_9METZ|nr:hypothetical protein LOD99_9722 [Oopsacas minuta]
MAESKVFLLTKEVEDLKRKLREVSHEKVIAINRCNEEWESKLNHQSNMSTKRKDIDKHQELSALEVDIRVRKDREMAEKISGKNEEIQKLREQFGFDKENAIIVTEIKLEEKWNNKIKKMQEHWKEKEGSYLQKISHLTDDKEALTVTIRNIREGDFDKRQEIHRMKLEHKEKIETITDMNRRFTSDNSREKKKLDEILKDKESEILQLMRKVDLLELSKELLERELLTYKQRVHGHGASLKTVGFNFSVSQKDMSKKIVSLENTVRMLKNENDELMNHRSGSRLGGQISQTSTPTGQDEKIWRLKKQREELRGIVTRLEEKCNELENRCSIMEEDYSLLVNQLELSRNEAENWQARVTELREENDGLLNENIDMHEKIRDYPVNGYAAQEDREGMLLEFEQEREEYQKELNELNEQKDALIIRCECLKNEYQAARDQTTRLLEDREQEKMQETQSEKQINRLRERNQRLEQVHERLTHKMEEQRDEIERLQMFEQRALQADAYKRQLDDLKRHH